MTETPPKPSPETTTSDPLPAEPDRTPTATDVTAEDTDNYIEAYHATAQWIQFADAKAGVVLTVGGALAGLLIPTVKSVIEDQAIHHLFPAWKPIVLALFCLFLLFLLLSGVMAFLCITPFRRSGRHPALDHCTHFHPAAVSGAYPKIEDVRRFVQSCDDLDRAAFRREVIAALFFDSHISNVKYARVSQSIRLFAVSALFAFLYLLAHQL